MAVKKKATATKKATVKAVKKPTTKSETLTFIAEKTELTKKDVITSYSIHYTKLYDILKLPAGNSIMTGPLMPP